MTVEADSGGHTDNRPLTAVLPVILALRDELSEKHRYARPVRVGAAGGIGTPGAAAAVGVRARSRSETWTRGTQGAIDERCSPAGETATR